MYTILRPRPCHQLVGRRRGRLLLAAIHSFQYAFNPNGKLALFAFKNLRFG